MILQVLCRQIFEHRIWQQIDIDDMQFGFMKGKGTTDAIFIVRKMQEHTHTQPFYGSLDFVRDNLGEPVPEETFTHRCRRSLELKERSSILALWIRKKLLIGF